MVAGFMPAEVMLEAADKPLGSQMAIAFSSRPEIINSGVE